MIERLAGLPAEAESASEFRYRDPYLDRRTLVVAVGQSGETADTVAAMHLASQKGGRLVTICNTENSQAARVAEGILHMRSGIEIGVASTKTFYRLVDHIGSYWRPTWAWSGARCLLNAPGSWSRPWAHCPRLVGGICCLTSAFTGAWPATSAGSTISCSWAGASTAPSPWEGALKLKELSYIHAEGLPRRAR